MPTHVRKYHQFAGGVLFVGRRSDLLFLQIHQFFSFRVTEIRCLGLNFAKTDPVLCVI